MKLFLATQLAKRSESRICCEWITSFNNFIWICNGNRFSCLSWPQTQRSYPKNQGFSRFSVCIEF
ncbi:hypothetical protein XELAEV_18039183mg [Xenopus laevis]|uniref:Uncharacterized protein n=1 Tax=Xenopus laevis TaxID=8355 RepID=A0A974C887_XENLA|nr:hypothetical protein XELAEV_18039183mg [Xenopus laevis]